MLRLKKIDISLALLVLVSLVGLITRFIYLGNIPWGLYWDETAMYVAVKSLLASAKDMHGLAWYQLVYPSYGDYKLPVYILSAWFSAKFLGLSAFSLRLPSALAGVATAVVAGLIGLKLLKWQKPRPTHKLKLFTFFSILLVVSFSPWGLMFSRTAFEAHLSQFILALAVYLLLLTDLNHKFKRWLFLPAVFFGTLSIYTYYSTRFVWPVVLLVVFLIKFFQLKKISQKSKPKPSLYLLMAVMSLGLTFLALLPLQKSSFYQASQQVRLSTPSVIDAKNHQDQVLTSNHYRQLAGDTLFDRLVFHRDLFLLTQLGENFSQNLSLNNLFLSGDPNLRHGTGQFGLFLLAFLPFFIIGLYQLAKNNHFGLGLLLIWWFVALLPASVPNETPHALRSLNALVPLAIIIGLGLGFSFWWLKDLGGRLKLETAFFNLILILVLTANFFYFINYYFKQYPLSSAASWQVGYKELANQIYQMRGKLDKDKLPVVILSPDDRFYLWLMAYGPYQGDEFATWPEKNFQKVDFDELYFKNPDLEIKKLKDQDKTFLIAGDNKKVVETIKKYHLGTSLCFPSKTGNEGEIEPVACLISPEIRN